MFRPTLQGRRFFASSGTDHAQLVDFFALLEVRRTFQVDLKAAETNYKRMQFLVHPDRKSQADATDSSSLLNEAISTLKNPLLRTEHLLKLHGIRETGENERVQNTNLLMEIMDLNESIDEASEANDRNGLELILVSLQKKIETSENLIATLYEQQNLTEVKNEADKMRFFVRTVERVQQLLRL